MIGAGPSGLVAAKYLLEEQQQQLDGGYQVTVVESSASIGGTFVNKVSRHTPSALVDDPIHSRFVFEFS